MLTDPHIRMQVSNKQYAAGSNQVVGTRFNLLHPRSLIVLDAIDSFYIRRRIVQGFTENLAHKNDYH